MIVATRRPARLGALALAAGIALTAVPHTVLAQDRDEGVSVTVYSDPNASQQPQNVWDPMTGRWQAVEPGFSIVKEVRRMDFPGGTSRLAFDDVAARLDASTVLFRSLDDPEGTSVVEQDFRFDLADANRILERYVDRDVTAVMADGTQVTGRLLSFDGGQIVLQAPDGLRIIRRGDNLKDLRFPALPGGLYVKPTLEWLVHAPQAGPQRVEVAYETAGMSWAADYTAVVSADEKTLDLSAWVTIRNQSGGSYANARLKLVAGDLNRAPQPNAPGAGMKMRSAREMGADSGPEGFSEKSFFEYHLYTLGRPTTLPDRSMKQIELFEPVAGVPIRKVYMYDGTAGLPWWWMTNGPNQNRQFGNPSNPKVGVFLEFTNHEDHGMGMPLPAGRVRVHKRDDADGGLELIGEDAIDHTPRHEALRLKVGDAFDVVGERKQTDFQLNTGQKWMRETFEIRVRNRKTTPITVKIKERMFRWIQWEIEKESHAHVKVDAQHVHFDVPAAADGETVVTYTVKYTW